MKIFLTGADGLLGSNVTRELLKRGHQVRAFLLPNSPSRTLDDLPIERFEGNILQPADLEHATQGCDAIIHAAANTSIWPDRSEIIRKVNVEGTRHVIQAALKAKVQRLIYIGTANSFGFGPKDQPGDETQPYRAAKYGLDYTDSKLEAQKLLLAAVKEHGLPAIVINPTFMLGPYDSKPSAGAMVKAVYEGKVPGYTAGGRNYVYVKDVAIAIANALTMGRTGECYIAGNDNMNYQEAFSRIAKIIGVKAPAIPIPAWASKLYGGIGTLYGKITGRTPTVSLAMARISADEHYFTAKKAVEELKLPQTNVDIAIRESFEWMRDNQVL